jgi:transposase-like protein
MKDKRARRKFSIEEKVAILKRHLVEQVPVSDLCEEHHIRPSLFYLWQRQMWENLGAAFENGNRADRRSEREDQLAKTVEDLKAVVSAREAKLTKKDRVIAELSAEFIEAKKAAGEL